MSDRPILLSIVAVIAILAGLFMLIAGAVTHFISPEFWAEAIANIPDAAAEYLGDFTLSDVKDLGTFLLMVGAVTFVIGAALFAGWSFSWYLAVIALIAEILLGAYRVTSGTADGLTVVVIAAVILLYLFTPKVREHFDI